MRSWMHMYPTELAFRPTPLARMLVMETASSVDKEHARQGGKKWPLAVAWPAFAGSCHRQPPSSLQSMSLEIRKKTKKKQDRIGLGKLLHAKQHDRCRGLLSRLNSSTPSGLVRQVILRHAREWSITAQDPLFFLEQKEHKELKRPKERWHKIKEASSGSRDGEGRHNLSMEAALGVQT